jgi:hypothetical protein
MSRRLHQQKDHRGHLGWQWDNGPIFVGNDGRKWAIKCGEAVQYLKDLTDLALLQHKQANCEATIEQLKELAAREKQLDFDTNA